MSTVIAPPHHSPVSVWPRFKAQVVDTFVVLLAASVLALVVTGRGMEDPGRAGVWLTVIVVGLLYFTLCEWRGGQTLGKKLAGIEVRSQAGGGASLPQAFVRTAFRLIDGLGCYVVGAAFVWTSAERQRLGDRVAGTLVVRSRPDAPDLRSDGTHRHDQEEAGYTPEVDAEINRPHTWSHPRL